MRGQKKTVRPDNAHRWALRMQTPARKAESVKPDSVANKNYSGHVTMKDGSIVSSLDLCQLKNFENKSGMFAA